MVDFIIAIGVILLLLAAWIFIQQLSRHYAQQHPQFGPPREEGSGCGTSCVCSNGNCKNKQQSLNHAQAHSNIKSEGSDS